ncbi:retron St85 family effector protein [Pedobacter nyackensis]|uniref:retron St85 family effector protein n=1 Tax=Pedobacter nyackensis TaxID=475255 RepID=UPI00292CDEBC|nr:retron St85 family effector protein [Pedobacter nyackensis]
MPISNIDEFSDEACKVITKRIRDNIFRSAIDFKTTVFLCGADLTKKTTIRHKVSEVLKGSFFYNLYIDLIYPEDLFDEILYSSNSLDLLSLENLLADSVDAVVIIPESPGSFAELGAFVGNEKLRNKIICVVDEKYKKDKSFVNQGPIKLIKQANNNNVVFINPTEIGKGTSRLSFLNILSNDREVEKIVSSVRKLKTKRDKNEITLLQLDKFLLPSIFLMEPVTKNTLVKMVGYALENTQHAVSSTATALSILTKKRQVELTAKGYVLTQLGSAEFLSFRKHNSRYKEPERTLAIDDLRLEILNLKNRNKRMKV